VQLLGELLEGVHVPVVRREEHHAHLAVAAAEPLHELQARAVGQQPVDDGDVHRAELLEEAFGVAGPPRLHHLQPERAERRLQERAHVRVVVQEQDPLHRRPLALESIARMVSRTSATVDLAFIKVAETRRASSAGASVAEKMITSAPPTRSMSSYPSPSGRARSSITTSNADSASAFLAAPSPEAAVTSQRGGSASRTSCTMSSSPYTCSRRGGGSPAPAAACPDTARATAERMRASSNGLRMLSVTKTTVDPSRLPEPVTTRMGTSLPLPEPRISSI